MHVPYDVVIVGADPAGLAAAYALASAGRRVAVVAAPAPALECPLADWAPAHLFLQPGLSPRLPQAAKAIPFKRLRYLNAALDKHADFNARNVLGYLLPAGGLRAALEKAAKSAGVKFIPMTATPTIDHGDSGVRVHCSKREVLARVALLTHASPAEAVQRLAFQAVGLLAVPPHAAAIELPLPPKARKPARKGEGALFSPDPALHMFEAPDKSDSILLFAVANVLHLRLLRRSDRPIELSDLAAALARLQAAGLAHAELDPAKATLATWTPPAGAAMEMVTHVARRSILAGPAGGFADTITAQTLAPGITSALTAAQVIHKSLDAADPQILLGDFDTAWQSNLAKHLAPPSTPLPLLLPLVFVNARILSRFTAAVLRGQDI